MGPFQEYEVSLIIAIWGRFHMKGLSFPKISNFFCEALSQRKKKQWCKVTIRWTSLIRRFKNMVSWKRGCVELRWVSAVLTAVAFDRKRSHLKKEAPAAASPVWSSIPSGQRTKAHLCPIHLFQKRRGRSVTSARTTLKGPSAPTASVLVRCLSPVWWQLDSYLKKASGHLTKRLTGPRWQEWGDADYKLIWWSHEYYISRLTKKCSFFYELYL